MEHKNIVDILMDSNKHELIEMFDIDGNSCKFEQVAVIPDGKRLYAILYPVEPFNDCSEIDAFVVRVDYDPADEPYLVIETDERMAIKIFKKYEKLLEKQNRRENRK